LHNWSTPQEKKSRKKVAGAETMPKQIRKVKINWSGLLMPVVIFKTLKQPKITQRLKLMP